MAEPKTDDPIIAGLLRERDGYLRTGQKDRAALVDEQLKLRGYKDPDADANADAEAGSEPEKTPEKTPPQGRTTRPRHTADTASTASKGKGSAPTSTR